MVVKLGFVVHRLLTLIFGVFVLLFLVLWFKVRVLIWIFFGGFVLCDSMLSLLLVMVV